MDMDMDCFDLYGNKMEIMQITLPIETAKRVLLRGLRYYLGEDAVWLPQYDWIAEWLSDNKRKGLLLTGTNGVGKSVICTKILPVIFKHYLRIQSNLELCCPVKATDIADSYEKNLSMRYAPILVIDDVGAESVSSHFGTRRDFVSELIDSCEDGGRLLIITTNLTADEISERYGMRTLDRLHSITRSFTIEHESLRR